MEQNGTDSGEELLTLDEAVQFLGTSKPTLYRLLSQGDLKGLKVGRQWRFRRSDLVAYMERSPVALAAASTQELDAALSALPTPVKTDRAEGNPETVSAEEKTELLCQSIL